MRALDPLQKIKVHVQLQQKKVLLKDIKKRNFWCNYAIFQYGYFCAL
jgi:hypothetical protein